MLLFSLLLTLSYSLFANDSVLVKSTTSGQDVYEVVYESDKDKVDLKPGIYRLNSRKDGESELIIAGKVLGANRAFNGVLEQLKDYANNSPTPIITVVDGFVTVLNRNSDSSKKNSILQIGKNTPVFDILNNRQVTVPPITNRNQVNTYVLADYLIARPKVGSVAVTVFVVSIASPHALGSGYTFLIPIEHSTGPQSQLTIANNKFSLIAYDYYTDDKLKKLQIKDNHEIYSPLLMESFLSRLSNVKDHPIAKSWKSLIDNYLKYLNGKSNASKVDSRGLPTLDVADLSFKIPTLVSDIVHQASDSIIVQSYNPYKDEWYVNILDHTSRGSRFKGGIKDLPIAIDANEMPRVIYKGKVDYDYSSKKYKMFVSEDKENYLVSVDDNFIFLLKGKGVRDGVEAELMLPSRAPSSYSLDSFKQYHFAVRKFQKENSTYYYVFNSFITKQSAKRTGVYVFKQTSEGGEFLKYHPLVDDYLTEGEMQLRIYQPPEKGILLFDGITEIKGKSAYLAKIEKTNQEGKVIGKRTSAHFNLETLIDPTIKSQYEYVDTVSEKSIVGGKLIFREFDETGVSESKTGFYTQGVEKPMFKPGSMNFEQRKPGPNKYLADQFTMGFSYPDYTDYPKIDVSVFPFSPNSNSKSTNYFQLGVLLSINGADAGRTIAPLLFSSTIPTDYTFFRGVKIIQGRRKKELDFHILVFLGDSRNLVRGIYSIHYTMGLEGQFSEIEKPKFVLRENIAGMIDKEPPSIQNFRSRIKADSEGNLYWIHDNSIPVEASGFAVRPLHAPSKLAYPNKTDTNIKLRFNEKLDTATSSTSSLGGQWYVYSPYDLKSKDPNAEKSLATFKTYFENNKDKGVTPYDLFHNFKDFFNSYANPSKKLETGKRQILIVEERVKKDFLAAIYYYLVEGDTAFSLDSRKGRNFDFFMFDENSTSKEIAEELERILESNDDTRGKILFADMEKILNASELVISDKEIDAELDTSDSDGQDGTDSDREGSDSDSDSDSDSEKESEVAEEKERDLFQAVDEKQVSRFLMLATDGKIKTLGEFKRKQKQFDTKSKIPLLMIATPQEYAVAIEKHKKEFEAGVFGKFQVNYSFLTNNWTLWPPGSVYADDSIRKFTQIPISNEEQRIFPTLEKLLNDAAMGQAKGKQIILVVPPGLKPLLDKLVLARWTSNNKEVSGIWNHKNSNLSLFRITGNREQNTQSDVFNNFEAMRAKADAKNVVLYSDLQTIITLGRPQFNKSNPYFIKDIGTKKSQFDLIGGKQTVEAINLPTDQKVTPHLMWYLASEGQRVSVSSSKTWDLKSLFTPKLTTIIVATENELAQLENEMSVESKFLDLKKHFEIVNFEAPTDAAKYQLLRALIDRPEIKSLEYDFSLNDIKGEEAKRQLLSHIINKTNQIAEQRGQEQTEAFIRVFTEFRNTLVEDIQLRRSRNVTKNYIDRFFSKVFPMPLNPEILEENDPLKMLTRTKQTIEAWKKKYTGSSELKNRVIQTVLNQTRLADSGRPVPSSLILFGGTGSGKTFLIESLMDYLGLVRYDSAKSTNEEASAIIIKVDNLVKSDSEAGGYKITVDQAISQIQDLLSQPNGHRAWILFDDIHKASSKEIHEQLYAFIQSFFNVQNGLLKVKSKSGSIKEIPVQNINLFMTVNPENDKELLKRYVENKDDIKGMVLASLTRMGVKVEESFLARFSDIINLDKFPRSAKVPALVNKIRESSKAYDHIVLVEPNAINKFVDSFPDANAREFLTPSASAFVTIPTSAQKSNLYIVTPKRNPTQSSGQPTGAFLDMASINSKVREVTDITAVTRSDVDSQLKLISFVLNNLRTTLYNNIVLESDGSPALNLDVAGLSGVLRKNFILGMSVHAMDKDRIPNSEVVIRPDDLPFLSRVQFDELYEKQKSDVTKKDYFPFNFSVREMSFDFTRTSFLMSQGNRSSKKSQHDVLSDYVKKIEPKLFELLSLYMRLPSPDEIQKVRYWTEADQKHWFESITAENKESQARKIAQDLIATFSEFQNDFLNPSLDKTLPLADSVNYHDLARLYAFVIDKALTRLPWGILAKFTLDITDLSRDLSLGQKPAFMSYAFKELYSPFAVSTSDILEGALSEIKNSKDSRFGGYADKSIFDVDHIRDYSFLNNFYQLSRIANYAGGILRQDLIDKIVQYLETRNRAIFSNSDLNEISDFTSGLESNSNWSNWSDSVQHHGRVNSFMAKDSNSCINLFSGGNK